MKKYKVCNIVLTECITLVFALLGWLVFAKSYIRLWETMNDFASSIRVYCYNIFRLGGQTLPTVTNNSTVLGWDTILPENVKELTSNAKSYFELFFSLDNLRGWAYRSAVKLGDFSKAITILLPSILIFFFVFRHFFLKENNRYNKDTLPLRIFKGASNIIYQPVKRFALQYVEYVKENSAIYTVWVIIWVCHLNLASIIIGFLAYYFYFAGTFDFSSFMKQFGKLIIDFQVIFIYFPYWSLLPIAYMIFDHTRQKRAYNKLRHMELKNRGFINALPIVSMTCGSMGKKKTTIITDMALSQAAMFREISLERLKKCDMKLPYFPWISFENELKKCMEYGTVYNLATIKDWMRKKRTRFEKHGDVNLQLYGYDIVRYGDTYDDKLKITSLWDVLETYAQLFYIYVIECSLIVANYSIREDDMIISKGNFPFWQSDFFPNRYPVESRHSHILDFDILRLGKKLMENNPNSGSFEFGVVVITEVGKERGNNLELKEIKKGTEETNQKNDLFNSWLKGSRRKRSLRRGTHHFIK